MGNEPIKDKAPKPPGLLPKNVQSWLIIGIALLMIVIMWLTSGKKQPVSAKPATPVVQTPAPFEVNQGKITELQNQIQVLQQRELAAQNALAQQQAHLKGDSSQENSQRQSAGNSNSEHPVTAQDAIKAERQKREYLSLFASNLALSYRKDKDSSGTLSANSPATSENSQTAPAQNADALALERMLQLATVNQPPVISTPNVAPVAEKPVSSAQPSEKEEEKKGKEALGLSAAASSLARRNAAAGKNYILLEGTVLETVLLNRLDGQFSGPVECLVATNVYSHDRQHLLIPAGTKVLGETKKVDTFGQNRLAVVFHRLLMPDGYSVSLDQFKGLDQIGDTGLRDLVNNHYLRIFGVSLAIGALGAAAEAKTGSALTANGSDTLRQGFAASAAQSASQILDRFLNILPTVTIREGHRVKVYLSGDLALPDYANHQMPSDL